MPNIPFKVKLLVYARPNLRSYSVEMESYIGRDVLDSLFDRMEQRPDVTSLMLSFPERWLNVLEQRQLYVRLSLYCPNLREVTIKTHSVYVIQCTCSSDISMMDEATIPESETGHLYHERMGGDIFGSGLTVLGGRSTGL